MKKYKKTLIIMLTIIFVKISITNVYAEDHINFKNITIDDGLSQSTTEVIFQDSSGYIWIGTNDGLNRYNGFEMKIYKAKKDEKNSISSNYITSITEDKKGNLWVGTENGLSKINLKDESIHNYTHYNNRPYYNIHEIFVTKDGSVLMATCNGMYVYNENEDDFERVLEEENVLTSQDIVDIAEDNYDNLWIGTEEGLNKVDIKSKKVYKYTSDQKNSISGNTINSIMCDDSGNLWVSTYQSGLNKINIKTNEIKLYKEDASDKFSIPSNSTRNMLQDTNGTIWIATEKGLSKYIKEKDNFITYKNKSYDSNSLANNIVYTIMEDSSGLIWVGTYTGISIFDPRHQISQYKSDPMDKNSLSDNVIHGIYEDDEGLLWIGTRDNGVNILNRKTGKVDHIYEGNTPYSLSTNSIRVITGKENTIWIGTRNGINEVNKESGIIRKYTTDDGLVSNNIKSLLLDKKGYLWVGTPQGLNILDFNGGEIIDMTPLLKKNGIQDTYIEEIYEDKNGSYWLGTFVSGELIKIDSESGKIKVCMTADNDEENTKSIRAINEDSKGNLWIGTSVGLIKFNIKTEASKKFTDKDGLSNNNVYGILLDGNENPWMSTNNGISKLDVRTNKFRNLSSTDGLQSNEFNGKAYYKCKDGEFLFGGVRGLNSFYPNNIVDSTYSPEITFDSFEVEGKYYKNIDKLSFKYNENLFRIKFFIPDYKENNNIQYYYNLEGANDKWVLVNSNEVIFDELDPGEYTFKVKARGQNGTIGKESSVSFTVEPPFWQSKEAILIYVIIAAIIIYANVTKVKRLDSLVEKRTNELSKEMEKNSVLLNKVIEAERNKNNYFVNLSHELRTPLNVINSVEQLISNLNKSGKGISQEKIDYYMDVMRKNTKRLLNLINNIIDTTKVENGNYRINRENHNIVYIVEEATLGLKDAIESSGINLIIDTDVEEKIILCDEYEIERCVVNIVSNASKFTPKGGTIKVEINDLVDRVKISIEDNGIGIDEKYHKSIFDRFNQVVDKDTEVKGGSGLGLTITKHIIDLHKGEIYVESEKNKGTKFTIILPVKH